MRKTIDVLPLAYLVGLLGMLLAARPTWGSVTGISVSESVNTSVTRQQTVGPPLTFSDPKSNSSFPPVTLNSHSQYNDQYTCDADVTISSYIGPGGVGDSTPGLTLVGSAMAPGPSSWAFPYSYTASSDLTYQFSLDHVESYTWSGNYDVGARLSGPGNTLIPFGSGDLQPGDYLLHVFSPMPFTFIYPTAFNLVITPEPGLLSVAVAAMALLIRRRAQTQDRPRKVDDQ
jgi:hypothetical protein